MFEEVKVALKSFSSQAVATHSCPSACVCVCVKSLQSCLTLQPYGPHPTSLLCPWDSPGKKTGVGHIPSSRGSSRLRD